MEVSWSGYIGKQAHTAHTYIFRPVPEKTFPKFALEVWQMFQDIVAPVTCSQRHVFEGAPLEKDQAQETSSGGL